jgi:uncharacterized protein (TIGR03067 family)
MSVRKHQITAMSTVGVGLAILLTWTQLMAREWAESQSLRDRLQGVWIASLAEEGENLRLEGKAAESCKIEFVGDKVVLHQLIGGIEGRGTYFVEQSRTPAKIDFKLDAGWIIGIYEWNGDTLKLCLNAFSLPERLGVPTRPLPKEFKSGKGRHLYVFRRVATRA